VLRVLVARSLAAAGDKRTKAYLGALRGYTRNGDVALAHADR
jgi:hypothetical protein